MYPLQIKDLAFPLKSTFVKVLLSIGTFMLISMTGYSQGGGDISGSPWSGCAGTVGNYSFSFSESQAGGYLCSQPSWRIDGGSGTLNASGNSASVTWSTSGNVYVDYCVAPYDGSPAQSRTASRYFSKVTIDAGTIFHSGSTASPKNICYGESANFTVSGNTGTVTWQKCTAGTGCSTTSDTGWTTAAASNSNLTQTTKFRTKLTGSAGCGTDYSNIIEIIVNANQTLGVTINNPGTICANTPVTFTANPTGAVSNLSYQWFRNNNPVTDNQSSGNTYNPQYPLQDNETVKCLVSTSTPCVSPNPAESNVVTMDVQALIPPQVDIIVQNQTMCQGDPVTFTASSQHSITSYSWKIETSSELSSSSSFSPSGEFSLLAPGKTVHLTVGVSGACLSQNFAEDSHYQTVYPPSSVQNLSVANPQICSSGNVDLSITSYTGNLSWKVRSKDGAGQWGAWSIFSSSNSLSNSHPVSSGSGVPRYYEYQVFAKSGSCAEAPSGVQSVTVYPTSAIGTLGITSASAFCSSGTASLSLSSYTGDLSWTVRYKDGAGSWGGWSTFSTTEATASSYPVSSGSSVPRYYEFKVIAKSGTCAEIPSNSQIVTVYPTSSIGTLSITNGPDFCSSGTLNLSVTSFVGDLSWKVRSKDGSMGSWSGWSTFSTSSSTANSFGVTSAIGVPRYYEFQTTAKSGICADAASLVVTATVYPLSAVGTLSSSNGDQFCSTGTVNLSLSSYTGDLSWQFRYKDGTGGSFTSWSTFSSSETTANSYSSLSVGASVERIYEFKVVSQSGLCNLVTSNTKTITVYPPSTAGNVIASPGTEFYGNASPAITLSVATHVGSVSFEKSIGGGSWTTTSNPVTITANTQFQAKSVSGNCPPAYSPTPLEVVLYPHPVVIASGSTSLNYGDHVTLSTGNFYSYKWLKSGVEIPGATNQSLIVTEPGVYTVSVKGSVTAPEGLAEAITVADAIAAQTDYNYISTITMLKGEVYDPNSLFSLSSGDYSQTTTYFDGLGRVMQTVTAQASPDGNDMVQPVVYDSLGREKRQYLPFISSDASGQYKANVINLISGEYQNAALNFYNNGDTDKIENDPSPFSEIVFESSPLNRILKQGAPGYDWKPNNDAYTLNDNTIKHRYLSNGTGEVLLWTYDPATHRINAKSGANLGYYPVNTLQVKKTYDEENNITLEYVDKQGRTMLKRVQATSSQSPVNDTNFASTYYIYDDFGNLVTVLPPQAVASLANYHNATATNQNTFLSNWAFRYKYDGRKRMTEKIIPGAGVVYMVYDDRDRLVLTQDGNQRASATKYWTFTKYDELNRPVLTGIKDTAVALTQLQMQQVVDSHYKKAWAKWGESYIGNTPGNIHGYSNKSYPVITSGATTHPNHYLTVNYYDNYLFRDNWTDEFLYVNDGLSVSVGNESYTQPETEHLLVIGQVTGTRTKVLDGGIRGGYIWLNAVNYFDDRNRVIQAISNNFLGGTDRTSNLYDFSGKILSSKTSHTTSLVTWKDLVASSKASNRLYKSVSGNGWNTAGAASVEQLSSGQDGWMELIGSEQNTQRMIGLSDQNTDANYTSIDYAFYLNVTNLNIFENGVNRATISGGYQASDRLKISRTGTTIKYYKNDVLVYTSPTPSTSALMVDVAFNHTNASLVNVRSSFSTKSDSVTRQFEYDQAGRLINTWHRVNAGPDVLISHNEYNELGQLIDKKLHSTNPTASDAKQSIDYRYNIRGWITKMNEVDVTSGDVGEPDDYLSIELAYNEDIGLGNALLFNGNISGMRWSSNLGMSDEKAKGYVYSYDPLNRITGATFKKATGNTSTLSWSIPVGNAFSERSYTYDLNGNIKTLTRKGEDGTSIDTLAYGYGTGINQSNRLVTVTDHGDDNRGFTELNTSGNDYVYDANGNMTWDRNKGGEELLTNGEFSNGNTGWVVSDTGGRLAFQNDTLEISANASATASLTQNNVIQPRMGYVVVIDMHRSSATGQVNIDLGGSSQNVTNSGRTVLTFTASSGSNFVATLSADFAGRISSIEVKGIVVVAYNFLNLPEKVTKGGDHFLNYYYDAAGRKLAQEVFTSSNVLKKRSDYSGEYFYENDSLKFIIHEEGRVVMTDIQPEYQYNLKDHLGNVRLTFTTVPEEEVSLATLETVNAYEEQSEFLNYEEAVIINYDLFDHTYNGTTGATYYSTRLTGGNTNAIYGLAKSLSVMPGDTIKMEVFAKYLDPDANNWSAALTNFMSAVASGSAPQGTLVDGGDPGSIGSGTFPFAGLFDHSGEDETAPKAYLNFLVFDRNYNLIIGESGFSRVTTASKESGGNVPHEKLERPQPLVINQPGYVYIYLSNENETPVEVFFDDFKVEHVKSPIVQMDDYYPFGLTFNSFKRENSVENKYKFNGKEEETALNLGTIDYGWRRYDPQIARFQLVDHYAEKYADFTPYHSALNNPLIYREVNGDTVELILGKPYTDSKGEEHPYGHVALRVYDRKAGYDYVYDYGRYDKTWGFMDSKGDGVLNVYRSSKNYLASERRIRSSVGFMKATTKEQDQKIINYYKDLIKNNGKKVRGKNGKEVQKTRGVPGGGGTGYYIQDYFVLGPNCTTISGDGLGQIGENWLGDEYDPRDALKTLESNYEELGLTRTEYNVNGVKVTVYDKKEEEKKGRKQQK